MSFNSNDQRTVPAILQGVTSQNIGASGESISNSNSVVAAGNANPQDATPGYLAAGEPGGNPSDVLVPRTNANAGNGSNAIVSVSAPAGTTGGGVASYYPGPVNAMLAAGWTNQQTDIANDEYQLLITTASPLTGGAHGSAWSAGGTLAASGGQGSLTWSAPNGLPDSITLNSSGVTGGTPAAAGTWSFLVSVVDSEGNHAEKVFSVTFS